MRVLYMIPIKRKPQLNNCLNFGLYTLVISIAVLASSALRRKRPDVVMTPGPSCFMELWSCLVVELWSY